MAHLLTSRTKYNYIEIRALKQETTFWKTSEQKEIKEAIEELEAIISELKTYIEYGEENGSTMDGG